MVLNDLFTRTFHLYKSDEYHKLNAFFVYTNLCIKFNWIQHIVAIAIMARTLRMVSAYSTASTHTIELSELVYHWVVVETSQVQEIWLYLRLSRTALSCYRPLGFWASGLLTLFSFLSPLFPFSFSCCKLLLFLSTIDLSFVNWCYLLYATCSILYYAYEMSCHIATLSRLFYYFLIWKKSWRQWCYCRFAYSCNQQ